MSNPPQDEPLRRESARFTAMLTIVEERARAAGVSREQYLLDVIEGKRPKIDPREVDRAARGN